MPRSPRRGVQGCRQRGPGACGAGLAVAAGVCLGLHGGAALGAPVGSGGPAPPGGGGGAAALAARRAGSSSWPQPGPSGRDCVRLGQTALPETITAAKALLEQVPEYVESYGPLGPVLFFTVFVLCECLSLPASPLLLSSGYIFGLQLGAAISLAALSTAASISFFLARTVFRPQLMKVAQDNETFQNINCAVEVEGFKIIFLLRLAPLLPFALSNYAYGLSSVAFLDFLLATILGCAPGTCAFVYLATTARTLGEGEAGSPWYVYAGGAMATGLLLKVVSDVAESAIKESASQEECLLIDAVES